jgi:hypothetical protein
MTSHELVRRAIADIVPGYARVADIGLTKQEFQVQGRTMHDGTFPTPSGKAHAIAPVLPTFAVSGDEFRLMTLRSEGQFNTVVYEEEDLYRGTTRRDVVMMSEADGARLRLAEGTRWTWRPPRGVSGSSRLSSTFRPETWRCTTRGQRDRPPAGRSQLGNPAFKSIAARLYPVRP